MNPSAGPLRRTIQALLAWPLGSILVAFLAVEFFYREHGAIFYVAVAGFVGLLIGLAHALVISVQSRSKGNRGSSAD